MSHCSGAVRNYHIQIRKETGAEPHAEHLARCAYPGDAVPLHYKGGKLQWGSPTEVLDGFRMESSRGAILTAVVIGDQEAKFLVRSNWPVTQLPVVRTISFAVEDFFLE